VIVNAKLERI